MKSSLVRLVSTLLLTGQMLPVGLPLFCDQVQRATPASCDQQMASHPSGPVVDTTTHGTPCANSGFCATPRPRLSRSVEPSRLPQEYLMSSSAASRRSPRPTRNRRSLRRPKPSLSQK